MPEYADQLEHAATTDGREHIRSNGVETREWDNGEYQARYLYDDGVVTEIVEYLLDGKPISKEELAKEFIVITESDIQEEVDAENSEPGCMCRGDCTC
jgi:hypothetical protein